MTPKFTFTTTINVFIRIEDAQEGDLLGYIHEDGQRIYQRVTSNAFGKKVLQVDTRWLPASLMEVCRINAQRIVDEYPSKKMQQLHRENSRESLLQLVNDKLQAELPFGGGSGGDDSHVQIGVPQKIWMFIPLDFVDLDIADLNKTPDVELESWHSSSPLKEVVVSTEQEAERCVKSTD